eukprot:685048-Rhodomonas_salina.1
MLVLGPSAAGSSAAAQASAAHTHFFSDACSVYAENKVEIRAAGGIEAVMTGVQQHADSQDVQKQGCWACAILLSMTRME